MKCFDSICSALKRKGVECDLVDIEALTDTTLSCAENAKQILKDVGASKRRGEEYYEGLYERYAAEIGSRVKKVCKSPVKVKKHCRDSCRVKVKAHKRTCPTKRYR